MNEVRIQFTRLPAALRQGERRLFVAPPELLAARGTSVSAVERHQHTEVMLSGLQFAIEDLQNQQRQSLNELQQVAVELATTAASWLTFAAIDRKQFAVDQLVGQAIAELKSDAPVRIRLNPDDHRLLVELQRSGTTNVSMAGASLIDDASLKRGSCVAENDSISIVSDLEDRLAGVRQTWLENLDDAQTERRTTGPDGREIGRVPDRRETA